MLRAFSAHRRNADKALCFQRRRIVLLLPYHTQYKISMFVVKWTQYMAVLIRAGSIAIAVAKCDISHCQSTHASGTKARCGRTACQGCSLLHTVERCSATYVQAPSSICWVGSQSGGKDCWIGRRFGKERSSEQLLLAQGEASSRPNLLFHQLSKHLPRSPRTRHLGQM